MTSVEGLLEGAPACVMTFGNWKLVLHLMPWRRLGEATLADQPLRVEIPISETQSKSARTGLDAGAAVHVDLESLAPPTKMKWWLGTGPNFPHTATASPLLARAGEERRRPVIFTDPEFGKLELDRSVGWFNGKIEIDGRTVDICVQQSSSREDRSSDARDIELAREAFHRIQRDMRKIRGAIAASTLSLYNDTWREDRPVLDAAGLLAGIELSSIAIHPNGIATIYHSDGGLFLDHLVEVRLKADGTVSEVCLSG